MLAPIAGVASSRTSSKTWFLVTCGVVARQLLIRPSINSMSDLTDSPRIEGLDDLEDTLNELGLRFLAVVETADIDAVKAFVESEDPPVFFQDPESGWSALHVAAMVESPELIQYLIEQGAIWNAGGIQSPWCSIML